MKALLFISLTFTSIFFFSHEASAASGKTDMETYIVFLEKPEGLLESNLYDWYTTFLPEATSSLSSNQNRIVHSYRNVITGFAAKLTPQEAKAMEHKEGFLSARVERSVSLLRTFTPKFLGLQQNLGAWKSSNYGEGVIIGMIDTRINHDHPSFSDQGMPPSPAKWRGKCDFNCKQACNNKLVGARSFDGGETDGSVLAAMEAAIEEGVDVLSISMGYNGSLPFDDDVVILGAFRAVQKGIFVSCAAGNSGPSPYSVTNAAPWVLTVGAGTLIGKPQTAPHVPGILKPDINILASWRGSIDNATTNSFNVEPGTSMSCPHLCGVAVLIKSAHPDWSPAAIKSAILTTGSTFGASPIPDQQNASATSFGIGSDHVNPARALDPGLVYDIEPDDYIPYLCGLGYSNKQVRMIVQRNVNCWNSGSSVPEAQLNYPTFSTSLRAGDQKRYARTFTNVGRPNSTYRGQVWFLEGVGVAVKIVPSEIKFEKVNEKASYSVTFTRLEGNVTRRSSSVVQGCLVWSSADGYEVVSSINVVLS